jgi:hypothetical protein
VLVCLSMCTVHHQLGLGTSGEGGLTCAGTEAVAALLSGHVLQFAQLTPRCDSQCLMASLLVSRALACWYLLSYEQAFSLVAPPGLSSFSEHLRTQASRCSSILHLQAHNATSPAHELIRMQNLCADLLESTQQQHTDVNKVQCTLSQGVSLSLTQSNDK